MGHEIVSRILRRLPRPVPTSGARRCLSERGGEITDRSGLESYFRAERHLSLLFRP